MVDTEGTHGHQHADLPNDQGDLEAYGNMGTLSGFADRSTLEELTKLPPTDTRLREEAITLLANEPLIEIGSQQIDVEDGIITLQGTVFHQQALEMIENRIKLLAGVKEVRNQMEVRAPMPDAQRERGV